MQNLIMIFVQYVNMISFLQEWRPNIKYIFVQ